MSSPLPQPLRDQIAAGLHQFITERIHDPDDGCYNDEQECMAEHPIHMGSIINDKLRTVYVDVDRFCVQLANEVLRMITHRTMNIYMSTGCKHGVHEHCCNAVNIEGEAKEPGRCKFCTAACICPCHREQEDLSDFDITRYVHHA